VENVWEIEPQLTKTENLQKVKLSLPFKINELATNSNNKNIRDLYSGINKCKRGYQPRNSLVKDENGDLLADSHNILNRWKSYCIMSVMLGR
jgi:hypothetical protein